MGASLLLHAAVFGTLTQLLQLPSVPEPVPQRQTVSISLADVMPHRPQTAAAPTPVTVPSKAEPKVNKPLHAAKVKPKQTTPPPAQTKPKTAEPAPTLPLKALHSEAPLAEVSAPSAAPSEPPVTQTYSPSVPAPSAQTQPMQTQNTKTTVPGATLLGRIRGMIEAAVTYPAAARRLRIEGVVRLSFILAPDGSVVSAEVLRSSGSTLLDARALDTLWDLSGAFPSSETSLELTIPITFSLRKS